MLEFVYLFKGHGIADGLYKIGISDDVEGRLRQLSGNPFDTTLIVKFPVLLSKSLESILHSSLGEYRVKGEWFRLPDSAVDAFTRACDADDLLRLLSADAHCTYSVGSSAHVNPCLSVNVFRSILSLEALNHKRYKRSDMVKHLGVSPSFATDMLQCRPLAYTDGTLSALLDFFDREGMPITVADLFTVETGDVAHLSRQ